LPNRLRDLLTGGDRRSIARSNRALALARADPSLIRQLVDLTEDPDWLVSLRALDLLEKLAHEHPDWIAPVRKLFIGDLADSDKWETRLQVVRALPLFSWTPSEMRRVLQVLRRDLQHPQKFVRAWALDSLAQLSLRRPSLLPQLQKHLLSFERSGGKAVAARARAIRERLRRARSA